MVRGHYFLHLQYLVPEKVRLLVHALTQDLSLEVETEERTLLEVVHRSKTLRIAYARM